MKRLIHGIAGGIGFLTILIFWSSTAISELFASQETVVLVKEMILQGMIILIPAMIVVGGSGMALGKRRRDNLSNAKKKRMPVIALNGLLILLPSAWFLADRASSGDFDSTFYLIQTLELVAGAINLTLMGLNIRDGLMLTGKIKRTRKS